MQEALVAASTVALTLVLAVFTGAALAGGHGHATPAGGDHGNGHTNRGDDDHGSSEAPSSPAEAEQHGHSHHEARPHVTPAPKPHATRHESRPARRVSFELHADGVFASSA